MAALMVDSIVAALASLVMVESNVGVMIRCVWGGGRIDDLEVVGDLEVVREVDESCGVYPSDKALSGPYAIPGAPDSNVRFSSCSTIAHFPKRRATSIFDRRIPVPSK